MLRIETLACYSVVTHGVMRMEMLAPQDTHVHTHTHTHTHTQERTAVGLTQDYLCLTCLSPTAARCSWPSRCFSLSFSLYSSLFHTRTTHTHTHPDLHTHTLFSPHLPATQYILSLKGIAFQAWIKQMGLRKHCCSSTQHLGLRTDSPHALQHAPLNSCTQTHMRTHTCTRATFFHVGTVWHSRVMLMYLNT